MKLSVFAVLMVIAGAYALPEQSIETREIRIVTNQIRRAIEQLRQHIRQVGLDPLEIPRGDYEYSPVPFFVEVKAFIDNLSFTGASNIVINSLDYSLLLNRLRFNISLPEIRMSIGNSGIAANVFGTKYTGEVKGSLAIRQIRLIGEVRVSVGIISGISIRSLSIQFSVANIKSDLGIIVMDIDYTNDVNTLLNVTIPQYLEDYRNEINKLLTDILLGIMRIVL